MRIAIVYPKLNLKTGGGGNYHLHLEASHLVELGHEVTVITLFPSLNAFPDDLPYRVVEEGQALSRIDKKYRLGLQKILRKYEDRVDVFHIRNATLALGAAIYRGTGGKVPVIVNLTGFRLFCTNYSRMDGSCHKRCGFLQRVQHRPEHPARKALLLPLRAVERCMEIVMLGQIDAFVALTEPMAEMYSWQNLPLKEVHVVSPLIDLEHLQMLRQNYTHKPSVDGQFNILYVGRLALEKGVDILIRAIPRLDPGATLHVVGDGPQMDELRQLTAELEVTDRVVFHGWVPHEKVSDFYLGSQLFIHPPRWVELFCLSELEAMALGVPMLVADGVGLAAALDGIALTFQRADIDDLVEKIGLIRENPSSTARVTERALERAKDFDYRAVAPQILKVYETVTGAESRAVSIAGFPPASNIAPTDP